MEHGSHCLNYFRRRHLGIDLLIAIQAGLTALMPCYAGVPDWWMSRRVIRSQVTDDHFAALNAGQFKNAVKQAIQEMNAKLAGGAGVGLNSLVADWSVEGPEVDNFEMVNVGQLKAVMKRWYDRLNQVHGTSGYPWANNASEDYFQAVNSGQLKKLLQIDVTLPWNQNLAQGFGTAAGPHLEAPTGELSNQKGVLAAADHYLRNAQLSMAARGGNPVAIPANAEAIANAPMATTAGEFKVGQDGSANYTIRLQGPKGVGNVEPAISLDYNSNGGDSIVGLGWNLSGLPVINRGPTSVELDGYYDPADFDSNDRFFLNGERLICTAGTYGADGSEYRTLKEQFSRILYHYGPSESWFEVRTKAGLIMEFGHSDSSGIGPQENGEWLAHPKLTWAVNKVSDSLGNYWDVKYVDRSRGPDAGEDTPYLPDYQPDVIRYTGNSSKNTSPAHEIRFVYEERPDQHRGYIMGFLMRKASRLRGIEIATQGLPLRSWRLGYNISLAQPAIHGERSVLTSVQEVAGAVGELTAPALPATTFVWDEGLRAWAGSDEQPEAEEVLQKIDYGGTIPFGETEDLKLEYRGRNWAVTAAATGATVQQPRSQWFSKQANYVDLDADGINEILVNHCGVFWGEQFRMPNGLNISAKLFRNDFRQVFRKKNGTSEWTLPEPLPVERSTPFEVSGAPQKWAEITQNSSQLNVTLHPNQPLEETQFPYLTTASSVPTGAFMMDVNADGLPDIVSSGSFDQLFLYWINPGGVSPQDPLKIVNPSGVWMNVAGSFQKVMNNDWSFPAVPTEIVAAAAGAVQARPATLPAGMIPSGENEEFKQPEFAQFKEHDLGWRAVDMDGDGLTDLIRAGQGYEPSGWLASAAAAPGSAAVPAGTGPWSSKGRQLCFGLRNKGPDAPAGQRWELINPAAAENSIWKLPLPLVGANGKLDMGRRLIDLNGDGLPDFIAQKKRPAPYPNAVFTAGAYDEYDLEVWLNRGASGWEYQGPDPVTGAKNAWTLEGMILSFGLTNVDADYGRMLQDVNGDNLPDLVVSLAYYTSAWAYQNAVFLNTGNGWAKNGGVPVNFSHVAPPDYLFSLSGGVTTTRPYSLIDMTGDGRPELINGNEATSTSVPGSASKVGLTQFLDPNGTWTSSGVARAQTDWNIPDNLLATALVVPLNFTELDGDGIMDVLRVHRLASTETSYQEIGSRTYFRQGLFKAPRVVQIKNGFGVPMVVEYGQLPVLAKSGSGYRLPEANGVQDLRPYPYQNHTPAGTVVTSYTTFDGTEDAQGNGGGTVTTSYSYSGLRYHAQKGSLGFEKMETASTLSPVRQETIFKQEGDAIGLPVGGEAYILDGQGNRQVISHSVTSYGVMDIAPALEIPGRSSRLVYANSVANENWSPEGVYMGKSTAVSTYATTGVDKGLLASQVVVKDQGTAGDFSDDTSVTTLYQYFPPTVSSSEWRIGQIQRTDAYATGPGTVHKASEFEYYPAGHASSGLLRIEKIDPDLASPFIREHFYDGYGNNVKTITCPGSLDLVTETWYGSDGRFPVASTNTLGHVMFTEYSGTGSHLTAQSLAAASTPPTADGSHSNQLPAAGGNLLYTTIIYDPWGTAKVTKSPDGLHQVRFTKAFHDHSLPRALYYVYEQSEGTCPVITYYDRYHRPVLVEKTAFNGEVILQEKQYDSRGHPVRVSQPYFAGGQTPGYTIEEYDEYDRKTKVTAPDGTWVHISYDGFVTVMTDHRGQKQTRRSDMSERIVESIDMAGNKVVFTHAADGQVTNTATVYAEGASPSTSITTVYNASRLKESVSDPDAGQTSIGYDSFGRIRGTRDAQGLWTVFRYDKLGRTTHRWTGVSSTDPLQDIDPVDYETLTVTTYDTGSGSGLGKPHVITFTQRDGVHARTVTEVHSYDSLGRPTSTTATLAGQVAFNGVYSTSTSYHPFEAPGYGRTASVTDAGGYCRAYTYNERGFLHEVHEGSEAGPLLWRGMAYDAEGKMLMEHHGNGVGTKTRYHPTRGFAEGRQTYRWTTNAPLQDLEMNVNDIGNVEWRRLTTYENTTSVVRTETFGFDSLNRLTSSHVVGQSTQSFTYQANGNIESKTGVGSYSYGEAGPHAVTGTVNGSVSLRYTYDAKGRMEDELLTASGESGSPDMLLRQIRYTSFNQPQYIQHWRSAALTSDLDELGDEADPWDQVCTLNFYFGPSLGRLIQVKRKGLFKTQVLTLSGYEIRETTRGENGPMVEKEERSSLGNGVRVKRWTAASPVVPTVAYEFSAQDHLGSDCVTYDGSGQVQEQRGHLKEGESQKNERQSYDAWGARRDAEDWSPADAQLGTAASSASEPERAGSNIPRGFTGHEMLDDVGLIHMNGRLYDQALGRMCAADPYVQTPENVQNYNRYSYVLNNPLSAIDPSGHFFIGLIVAFVGLIIGIVGAVITTALAFLAYLAALAAQFVVMVVNIVVTGFGQIGSALLAAAKSGVAYVAANLTWGQVLVGATLGALQSGIQVAMNGGSFSDILKAAALGALTGAVAAVATVALNGVATGITGLNGGTIFHQAAHGVVSGAMQEAQGGSFRDGFIGSVIGAGVGAGVSSIIPGLGSLPSGVQHILNSAVSAVSGGVAAEATGGKFADGAWSGAFTYVMTAVLTPSTRQQAAESPGDVEFAKGVAERAYNEGESPLLKEIFPTYVDDQHGFGATAERGPDGKIYIGFRGTNPSSLADWGANVAQALGFRTFQYEQAVRIADAAYQKYGGNVIFVGHSLGGGLASAAAYHKGGSAMTFNSAGVSWRYRTNNNVFITATYTGGEILSLVQDFSPLPNAAGYRSAQFSSTWWKDPISLHLLKYMASP